MLTVTGIFREVDEESQPARSFCRTFTAVSKAKGTEPKKYLIVHDMLKVTDLTDDQKTVSQINFNHNLHNNLQSSKFNR